MHENLALREAGAEVLANGFDISSDIETLDVRRLIQLLVHPGDGADPQRCVLEVLGEFRFAMLARLEAQHAHDQRQAVLHPMVHLLDEKLMALQRGLQIALMPLALDRHPQDVGCALQEREIMLDELVFRSAVDLEHAKGPAISLQYDVHRAMNAMPDEYFGRSEPFFAFEMIGNHRPAGFQRKSGGGGKICADARDADNARIPADPGPDQKAVFGGNIFEHFAKFGAKTLRSQTRRIRQQLLEPGSLQRANAELGQDLLLPDALVQSAQRQV